MGLIRSLIRIFSGSMSLYGISSISDSTKADCLSGPSLSEDENKNNVLKAVSVTNDYIANEHGQLCMFTSLFFGILDPGTGIFTYINSGHEPPLIISSAGGIKRKLKPTGPVIGTKPNVKFSTNQVEIESGDILIGYTDGVTEALAPNGELFSREQLLSLLEQPSVSASDIIEKIKTRLSDFISDVQQSDDVTLIAVQRLIRTA